MATQSVTVKELLEDTDAGAMIPLPNVTSKSELLRARMHNCLELCRGDPSPCTEMSLPRCPAHFI